MKKIFILLIIVLLGFSSCGGGQAGAPTQEAPVPDEADYAVVLTIPAVFFEEGENVFSFGGEGLSPGDDLKDYIADNDFIGAEWNSDGSLTIAMSIPRFETFKKDMIENTYRALNDIVEDDAFPFVLGFEATEEFKTVTMLVDRTGYGLSGANAAFLPVLVGLTVGMYRGFVGEDEYYTVIIADIATGERIEWIDFPID